METKKYKCYACGAETPEGDFTIKQGNLENGGYGLCRTCVNKGISVTPFQKQEPLKSKPITEKEFKKAWSDFFDNFNLVVNAIEVNDLTDAYRKAVFAFSKIYGYTLSIIRNSSKEVSSDGE